MSAPDLGQAKAILRAEALAARDAISTVKAIENAIVLADRADELGDVVGLDVAAYWPIRSEIDPRPLMFALRERGARVLLPVPTDDGLVFRLLTREGDLEPVGFGTHAPRAGSPEADPDLILAPLAAFDAEGHRLGYGGGFYDRTMARLRGAGRNVRMIGLAHAAQEVLAVPVETHDIALEGVLCETGLRAISGV